VREEKHGGAGRCTFFGHIQGFIIKLGWEKVLLINIFKLNISMLKNQQ